MSEKRSDFESAGQRARTRISFARWCSSLGQSAPVVFLIAATIAVLMWMLGSFGIHLGTGIVCVGLWLAATTAIVWWRRPTQLLALAEWDERTGRQEVITSAFCFASQDRHTSGEQLHIARATRVLETELPNMPRQLPIQLKHRAWLAPVAFLTLTGLLMASTRTPAEPVVDAKEQDRAREFAEQLEEKKQDFKDIDHLEPEEQKELKNLENSVDDALKNLKELDDETRRDVLAELENQAHQAAELAKSLAGKGESLSSEMLAELERHADTADFASAARAEKPDDIAEEAEELAEQLQDDKLTSDERKRIEQALEESLAAASASDRASMIGKHMQNALQRLQKRQPKQAGQQFQKLAKQMQQALQRQQTQQQLQQLAKQLRNAGQKIFGKQNNIRQLTKNSQKGLRQLNGKQQPLRQVQLQQRPGQQGNQQIALATGKPSQNGTTGQAPVPGATPAKPGNQKPVPGAGNQQGSPMPGQGSAPIPGSGQTPGQGSQSGAGQQPGQGAGQSPGQGKSPGQGSGSGAGAPVPGSSPGGQGAGQGGHQAGHGSAPYGNTKTKPLAASKSLKTDAQVSGDGPSMIRNIEGQQHREEAARKSRELAVEFIKTQEEALAEEALPISRREQVLRYFTALRRQLVESEKQSD